jgi:shikimate kinase
MSNGTSNGTSNATSPTREDLFVQALGTRPIVLVGMMGSGKSSIGRRLADRLGLPFVDSDVEIERDTDMTISALFKRWGEAFFRPREKRTILKLLTHGPCVLATGGGAFMDPTTRDAITQKGISVWLKADVDVLFERVKRRRNRPLLRTQDPKGTLAALLEAREPHYAQADITVLSDQQAHEIIVERLMDAIETHMQHHPHNEERS